MRTFQRKKTQAIYTIGPQQIKHETSTTRAQTVRNVQADGSTTPILVADEEGVTALCESYGVPWAALESVTAGTAFLIDGRKAAEVKGREKDGRFWSLTSEIAYKVGVKL